MTDNEEQALSKSIEAEEWKTVGDLSEMKGKLQVAASETALKDYRINVRISKRDRPLFPDS